MLISTKMKRDFTTIEIIPMKMKPSFMKLISPGFAYLVIIENSLRIRERPNLQEDSDHFERSINEGIKDYFCYKDEYKKSREEEDLTSMKEEKRALLNTVTNYNLVSKQLELESGVYQQESRQRVATKLIEAGRRR